MEQKLPRARHRFDFSGRSEQDEEDRVATDQILISLDLLAKSDGILDEEEHNLDEAEQIVDPLESTSFSHHRSPSLWVLPAMLLSVVVVLWVFGLIPRMIYEETVDHIGTLVAKIPSADIAIIAVIWIVALGIGLLGRRVTRGKQFTANSSKPSRELGLGLSLESSEVAESGVVGSQNSPTCHPLVNRAG